MSVTFYVARGTVREINGDPIPIYEAVHPDGYSENSIGSPWEMNVTERNAAFILRSLGIEQGESYGGVLSDLEDLITRCDSVLSMANQFPDLDAGQAPSETVGESGIRIIDCGIPVGYLCRRISQLKELALTAKRLDCCVAYA